MRGREREKERERERERDRKKKERESVKFSDHPHFRAYLPFYLLPTHITRRYFAVIVARDKLSFNLRFPRFLSLVLLSARWSVAIAETKEGPRWNL